MVCCSPQLRQGMQFHSGSKSMALLSLMCWLALMIALICRRRRRLTILLFLECIRKKREPTFCLPFLLEARTLSGGTSFVCALEFLSSVGGVL